MGSQTTTEGGDQRLPDGIKIDQSQTTERKEVPRAAVARAEWQDLLDQQGLKDPAKIEAAKAERLKKVDDLKKAATGQQKKEGWVNNPAKPGFTPESFVKGSIEGRVNDALKDKLSQIQQLGLPQATIDTFKTAAVDHIYSFYIRNGNEENATKEYVEKILIPKATFLFENLDKVYKSGKYPFTNTFDCLQKFSDFSGLNFAQGDSFSLKGLQNLMEADQNTYNTLINNFSSALGPMREAEQLDKALKSLQANGTSQKPENPQTGAAPEPGKTPTAAEVQSANPTTPASVEVPKAQPEKPAAVPIEEPKLPQNPTAAPVSTPPATPTSTTSTAPEIKTETASDIPKIGNPTIDNLIEKLYKLYERFKPFLVYLGLAEPEKKVAKNLLSPKESEEAKELQDVLAKTPYDFPKETLDKLFSDQKKFKSVLDAKHDQKVDWPTYLATHLDGQKINELKNNSSLTAEDVTQRFLTEIPKPVAPVIAVTQPAAAQVTYQISPLAGTIFPSTQPVATSAPTSKPNPAVQNPPA